MITYTIVNARGGVISRGAMPSPPPEVIVDLDALYGSLGTVIKMYAPDNTYWDGAYFVPLKDFDDFNTLSAVAFVTDHFEFSYGTALPNPTMVSVLADNPSFIGTGGEFELVSDGTMNIHTEARGNYVITLRADGFAEKKLEVTVT